MLPNRHLVRADALPSFLFEIPFSMPFLDLSAIVVWWHLLAFQQLFSSFSWAFFVRALPQNHGKLHLLGMKRHRLSFLPCRCRRHHHRHHHRHLHQTHPSSLSLWFVVMCCRLKSPSRNSEDLNQQEFLRLHLHPGKFKIGEIMTRIRDFACSFSKSKLLKHRMLLFQQRTQETKLRHLFDC